jgi:hypothetical protein
LLKSLKSIAREACDSFEQTPGDRLRKILKDLELPRPMTEQAFESKKSKKTIQKLYEN